ncbi:hypothetical protein N1851_005260 [Merluccius polli]|uniref:Endonuclease/exonuclease/phosphatase domain-containing protein n=1 Tax=Merluccius polli TaxID=89951 RepID=A0AA47N620_MERPO|nr:hypothetical protein N1851_005260 [Merluccius polli]
MEWLLVAWLILASSNWAVECLMYEAAGERLVYSGIELLQLREDRIPPSPDLLSCVPRELLQQPGRARRRGRKGGVRQRVRRAAKLPLPPILLCNARALRRKMDELRTQTKVSFEYRESGLLVFTETWLNEDIPDSLVEMEGFTLIRSDRRASSGKKTGGGLCVYIRDKWCCNVAVRDKICNPDLELLCITLRPYYLPREFSNIFVCVVYVPPDANATRAASRIADCVHQHLQNKPDATMLILGDMNHCKLEAFLPGFQQYVKCNTRKDKVLDKCYVNR